jgi:SAM-dependent methyltransferase
MTTNVLDIQSAIINFNNQSGLITQFQWNQFLQNSTYQEQYEARQKHIQFLGFPIITKEVINELNSFLGNMKVADLGCGTGYISAALQSRGVNIDAYDNYSSNYSVGKMNNAQYCEIHNVDYFDIDLVQYHAILMSWPDYDSDNAFKIACKMKPGQILIYQGESKGGCTADDNFFDLIDDETQFFELIEMYYILNEYHVNFSQIGIHDHWRIYRKR